MDSPGSLIRQRRLAADLTQARLALRAGTTQAAISRLEHDRISPTIDTLAEILLALGEELDPKAKPLASEVDPARLNAIRRRPPQERVELAFGWNRLAGEIGAAGARARAAG